MPCLVATSSLELGINMGAVDLVIQVESPKSVARGLQRIGRAGHNVGEVSRGRIFPKFRADLLECAVVARRMREGLIETTVVPRNPLDVLAQQIVAIAAAAETAAGGAETAAGAQATAGARATAGAQTAAGAEPQGPERTSEACVGSISPIWGDTSHAVGVGGLDREPARRALLGPGDPRRLHPDVMGHLLGLPEGGVYRQDFQSAGAGHCPPLGDMAADHGQCHLVVDDAPRLGVREVLRGGPDGGSARRRLQGDEARPQTAPPEQESSRGRELRTDREPPAGPVADRVAHRLQTEEIPGVHLAEATGPIRRPWPPWLPGPGLPCRRWADGSL